jgi:hypothetical protein
LKGGKMKNRKGQLSLADAPTVVLLVGMVFLVMATIAFIGQKYGAAIPSSNSGTSINDSITVTTAGVYVGNASKCNFEDFAITALTNASGTALPSTYYVKTDTGLVRNITDLNINGTAWKISYTYSYAGIACDVNNDLQVEISNNTSIAGIVLTISLVGIVLSVLIGIFLVTRNRQP